MLKNRARVFLTALAVVSGASCSRSSQPVVPGPTPPGPITHTVQSVTDGDTIRLTNPFIGTTSVRLLNIDAPELGQASQEPWASASRDALRLLLPAGASIQILTDRVPLDSFNRILGIIVRSDGVDVNREQLRLGQAVTYFIWPNAATFTAYRVAQIEAQDADRGIWRSTGPLVELPFENRLRANNDRPFRPVGDALTGWFVDAADYRQVHVNNRLFFGNVSEALSAGYRACPGDVAGYSPACFAAGR